MLKYSPQFEPRELQGAVEPAYSEDGVDLTLIRWMLSLTPWERLGFLEGAVESTLELRDAYRKSKVSADSSDAA